jgi:hypothetical protein
VPRDDRHELEYRESQPRIDRYFTVLGLSLDDGLDAGQQFQPRG